MLCAEKPCKTCGEIKVLEEFTKDIRCIDGCRGTCKKCKNIREKKRAHARRDEYLTTCLPHCKVCTKCGQRKHLGDFTRDSLSKDGHYSTCKECRNFQRRSKIPTHSDMGGEKECGKCCKTKKFQLFYRDHRSPDGHNSVCKSCKKEYITEYLVRNPEKADKRRDSNAAWRAANPDAVMHYSRLRSIKEKLTGRPYLLKRRQTIKHTRLGIISRKDIISTYGMVCSICHRNILLSQLLTIDHVVPLSRGGTHTLDNLRPAHGYCNTWKSNRLPEEIAQLSPPSQGEVDFWWTSRRTERSRQIQSEAARNWWVCASKEQVTLKKSRISKALIGNRNASKKSRKAA